MLGSTQNPQNSRSVDKTNTQKILRSVSYERGFHFFSGVGRYTGETAISLFSLVEELKTMEVDSVRFHFDRLDYQKWISETLGDEELAERLDKIDGRLLDKDLKVELINALQTRLDELYTILKTP